MTAGQPQSAFCAYDLRYGLPSWHTHLAYQHVLCKCWYAYIR